MVVISNSQAWAPTCVPWVLTRSRDGRLSQRNTTPNGAPNDEFIFKKHKEPARKTSTKPFFHGSTHPHQPRTLWNPKTQKIAGNDELSLFYNAHFYTDDCLKALSPRSAKKPACGTTPSWSSWGDHGHRLPPGQKVKLTILPYPWSGPVVLLITTFNQAKTTSQTDVMPTLLAQLGLDARIFTFAKRPVCPGAWVGLFAF